MIIRENKICLGLVSEVSESFINQAKLCISSFRRNAGKLKNIPIVFVTNNNPLSEDDRDFFIKHFSPIEFIVKKRIDIIPPASKFNILDAIDTNSYDIMIFMDCDTVVLRELDDMLIPLINDECDFLCRMGGKTDRSCFLDIKNTLNFLGMADLPDEIPKFNSGVFAFRNNVSKIIGETAKNILPKILNKNHLENMWMGEQCAFALSVTMENIKWKYLDEIYNSWGNLEDIRILHCFKSRYKFNRNDMFRDFNNWKNGYGEIIGERLLLAEIESYLTDFPQKEVKKYSGNCAMMCIPKNACVSVSNFTKENNIKNYPHHRGDNKNPERIKMLHSHDMIFCILRNPIDRVMSAYYYLSNGGRNAYDEKDWERYCSKYENIEDFILNGLETAKNEQIHFHSQQSWLVDSNGNVPLERIEFLKFESLDDDLRTFSEKYGFKYSTLKHENESDKQFNVLSEKSLNKIRELYSEDYELYRINFDTSG